ncbi:MAG TPA: iron-sulfur cluster assembly accessory protein [Candidatus Tectomicrobia bacterium]|nr:iron-sulfur cluster assembly accessory protein [Candidatus Tectomicrobia bacterium]
MIAITEAARQYISDLLADEERRGLALRLAIVGRRPGGFQYKLGFVREDEKAAADVVVDTGSFRVFVDAESAPNLQGATLDFIETPEQSGFKIHNPNAAWTDPQAIAIQKLFDEHINPALADHGGYVVLLDVKDDIAYVALGGGCQGCGMADVTLKQGIEALIMEEVPGIRQVVDTTDHASGTNPYYQPAKGGRGQSPFG